MFNISAAEVERQDSWQSAIIAVALVTNSPPCAPDHQQRAELGRNTLPQRADRSSGHRDSVNRLLFTQMAIFDR
jgi:hypothetical protein